MRIKDEESGNGAEVALDIVTLLIGYYTVFIFNAEICNVVKRRNAFAFEIWANLISEVALFAYIFVIALFAMTQIFRTTDAYAGV